MQYYLYIKTLHVIAIISWMAALLYMPRLFVYHADTKYNDSRCKMLQIMEEKLMVRIMNPAALVAILSGLLLLFYLSKNLTSNFSFVLKLFFVLTLTIFHLFCGIWRRRFATGTNVNSSRFFRIVNEIPAVLLAVIVFMVVVQPFDK